jgi:Ca-activated chloride channel family protein
MSRQRSARSAADQVRRNRNIVIVVAALVIAMIVCSSSVVSGGMWLFGLFGGNDEDVATAPSWATDSAELTVAVSPVMAEVMQEMANSFNSLDLRTPDNKKMTVWIEPVVPEQMVEDAMGMPAYQAISPDSSLWLDQLEQEWAARQSESGGDTQIPIGQRRISNQTRYAVSPIVIATWERVARELGWPNRPVGWQEIQEKATNDPDFKWNHSATNNASGLLATLAEFYAGAGLTRGLTVDAATKQATLDYVQAVESTVRFMAKARK